MFRVEPAESGISSPSFLSFSCARGGLELEEKAVMVEVPSRSLLMVEVPSARGSCAVKRGS